MSDKHAQMREMARDLIRDSVIEDAIAQRIAQIVEFIHEDRIKPLQERVEMLEERVAPHRRDPPRVGRRPTAAVFYGGGVMKWQPIETAPSKHLIFYGNTRHDVGVVFTGWKAMNGIYYTDSGEMVKPTHWMPLPEPPKEEV